MIMESSKLAQKECRNKHDSVGKLIHRELCKRMKFDHSTKWYIQKNSESVLKNERYRILLDYETQLII